MEWLSQMRRRLAMLLRGDRFERNLEEELRSHLEMQAEENEKQGIPADQARHAARRQLGNPTIWSEQSREVWSIGWLERTGQDVRFAFRIMRRAVASFAAH